MAKNAQAHAPKVQTDRDDGGIMFANEIQAGCVITGQGPGLVNVQIRARDKFFIKRFHAMHSTPDAPPRVESATLR